MKDNIKEEFKKIRIDFDRLFVEGYGDYNLQRKSCGDNFAKMVKNSNSVFCIKSIENNSVKLGLLSSGQEVSVPFDTIKDKPIEISEGFINNENNDQRVYVITLQEGYGIVSVPSIASIGLLDLKLASKRPPNC